MAAVDGIGEDENLPDAASRLAIMGRYRRGSSSDSDSSSSSGATYQPKCSFLSYVTSTNFSTQQPTTSQPSRQVNKEDQHRRRQERAKKKRQAELEADVSLLVETYFNARGRRGTSSATGIITNTVRQFIVFFFKSMVSFVYAKLHLTIASRNRRPS